MAGYSFELDFMVDLMCMDPYSCAAAESLSETLFYQYETQEDAWINAQC